MNIEWPVLSLNLLICGFFIFLLSACNNRNSMEAEVESEFWLSECRDSTSQESCYWRVAINTKNCSTQKKCSKLVVLFSGGDMGCDDSALSPTTTGYQKIEAAYVKDDYIFVCAGSLETREEAGKFAYHKSKSRVSKLLKSITSASEVRDYWTGENLLISGASQGASVPVIAMALNDGDDPVNIPGVSYTAACFYDGSYDAVALDKYLIDNINNSQCRTFRERAICNRYTSGDTKTECEMHHATILPSEDMYLDSILTVGVENYSILDWKLVECGSALSTKCGAFGFGDIFPKDSISQLCDNFNRSGFHHCDFDSLPTENHISCASGQASNINKCRVWFNEKIAK